MKHLAVIPALVLASPAAADCYDDVTTAAFKRTVAKTCGYFVNRGEVEEREPACRKQLGAEAIDAQRAAIAGFAMSVKSRGLKPACHAAYDRMPGGFVAD